MMAWSLTRIVRVTAQLLLAARIISAYPYMLEELDKRQITAGQLASAYDYIVVGGGQSGLVVANRLSEDPTKTVLIVEYGYLDNDQSVLEPSRGFPAARNMYNLTSLPQAGLNNRRNQIFSAAVVGGGSAVNGMYGDRGAAIDYDNWEALGNPGWGFQGLLPYFKKALQLYPPPPEIADFNITHDIPAAYGDDSSPIKVSYPPWQWPGQKIQWKAWLELGVQPAIEHAAGQAHGVFWIPTLQDPRTQTRSYARTGYFNPVATRTNLHLLTGYRVNRVQFSTANHAESVVIQQRGTPDSGGATTTVSARKEIILSAGWLHTPQVLQRSGIGRSALLSQAGISVRVDLPGVGANLQDHSSTSITYQYGTDVFPNPGTLRTNTTFRTWADNLWRTNRTGPNVHGVGNSAAFISLPQFDTNYQNTISRIGSQNIAQYLPTVYESALLAGYQAQRNVLMQSYASWQNALLEFPFNGGPGGSLVSQKPLSRGTVALQPSNIYAEPNVDYHVNLNPIDLDIYVSMVRYVRRWFATPAHQVLTPREISPGASITTDDQIKTSTRNGMTASIAHSCCTSAMMPRDQGGVVGPDLLVYGVTGLSVADGSIMPLIPATHLCQTTYALAEKAADIIKSRA